MKADPVSLLSEFIQKSQGSQYVIPVYQRNYTWKKNVQVKKLLEDIVKILEGKVEQHFIGTIVYVVTNNDLTQQERAVVDGQQRLTTLFLTLHVIKQIAKEIGEDNLVEKIKDWYLENSHTTEKFKFRLKPLVSDDEVYIKIAENKINRIENTNSVVYENYLYIKNFIERLLNKYTLNQFLNALNKLYIVYIQLDKDDNAQQIFESINSTGESLTSADLIRNYVLMNKESHIQEKLYQEYWLELEKIFNDSKNTEEFFRFYLASKDYTLPNKREVYDEFKLYWGKETRKNTEENILIDILNYAYHYKILYLSDVIDKDIEEINDLRKLKSNMPAPFLMGAMELYRINKINKKDVKNITELVITYLIRRHMMGQDTSSITRFFPTLLRNVLEGCEEFGYNKIIDITKKYLINDTRQKSTFMPDDDQLRHYLKTANAYSLSHTRWLLDKIEHYNNRAKVDLSLLNIEHIMPQSSNEFWISKTKGDIAKYENYVNRLGNLTLAEMKDNSQMGNNDFNHKKNILSKTQHINLNNEILQKKEWNTQDIDARTEKLTNIFLNIFPYTELKIKYETKLRKRIYLESMGISAEAIFHSGNNIEVLSGSEIRQSVEPNNAKMKQKRKDLIDSGIIKEEDGKWIFDKNCGFNSVSNAADLIMGGSNKGLHVWKDANGDIFNNSFKNENA